MKLTFMTIRRYQVKVLHQLFKHYVIIRSQCTFFLNTFFFILKDHRHLRFLWEKSKGQRAAGVIDTLNILLTWGLSNGYDGDSVPGGFSHSLFLKWL